jgi:hypothetical protein
MENTPGITMEVGITPIPIAPKNGEAGKVIEATKAEVDKSTTPAEPESSDVKKNDQSDKKEIGKQDFNQEKQKELTQTNEAEIDPLMEKKEEIEKIFALLGGKLGKEIREKIINKYVNGILEENEQAEKNTKLVESLAELSRVLKLIFALLMLAVLNPKPTYSGKDLRLSDSAPEGDTNEKINEALSGKNSRESWKNFKDEVEKIEELPFDKFMNEVLAANARHSVTMYKPRKEENGNIFLKNKRILNPGKFGRNVRLMKPAVSAR